MPKKKAKRSDFDDYFQRIAAAGIFILNNGFHKLGHPKDVLDEATKYGVGKYFNTTENITETPEDAKAVKRVRKLMMRHLFSLTDTSTGQESEYDPGTCPSDKGGKALMEAAAKVDEAHPKLK